MIDMVVILAGGLATRLRPITETIPKAMVIVNDRPFIEHQIDLLKKNSINKIVLCVGFLGENIEAYLGNGTKYGVEIKYSYDGEKLLGTGGAIRKAISYIDDTFYVLYGDSYLDIDYQVVGKHFETYQEKGLMTVYPNADRWDKSNVIFANGMVTKYDKKSPTPDMKYIDYGLGILRKEVIAEIPTGEVYDLADLYYNLVDQKQLLGYEVKKRFYEIGSHAGLGELSEYLKERQES